MNIETSQAPAAAASAERHLSLKPGPARQCVVVDRNGKRMVLPRYSEAQAIEQIAIAIVGRGASPEQKRIAWECLRDQEGYAIRWLQPRMSEPSRSTTN